MIVVLNKPGSSNKNIIKIDGYDTWNVDVTLARICAPLLKEFKQKSKTTYTNVDEADVPEGLFKGTDDIEIWQNILDQMIYSFEELSDPCSEDKFYKFDSDDSSDYLSFDKDAYTQWSNKVNRGTFLFGKYFKHLWS